MEYCSGGGIIDLMNARLRDRLREEEVLKIFGDVCAGVAVMHHQDPPLMHRDLKVENILMSPSTAPDSNPNSRSTSSNLKATFKLCDFGSAAPVISRKPARSMEEVKRVEADLNKHTTLQYRAPEMVDVYQRRVIDEKADIWALGVLLYKLCYYTTPFEENGGGPLAILNVQYRIPPQPVYSQRLKDLIGSLLKEQSSQRPTIDQVIIDVHRLLGTQPPATALHYAQQTLSGKIATPLPTLVSKASAGDSAKLDGAGPINIPATESASGAQEDLITIGPSRREREEAEARELNRQKDSITPMRRGRPTKNPDVSSPARSSFSQDNQPRSPPKLSQDASANISKTAQSWNKRPQTLSAPSPKPPGKAETPDGFGNSFAPSRFSVSPLPSPGTALSNSPSPSVTQAKSRLSPQLDHLKSTGPENAVPGRLRPSSSSSHVAMIGTGSSVLTPMTHSPALPGFSVSPSPTLPPTQDTKHSDQPRAVVGSSDLSGAEGRFPSVEELDARYATPSPLPSPSPSAGTGLHSRQTVNVPGLANRASVGAIADRFNRSQVDVDVAASRRREAFNPSAAMRRISESSKPTQNFVPSSINDEKPAPPSRGSSTNTYRQSLPVPYSKSNERVAKSQDWLTGDHSDDDASGQSQTATNGATTGPLVEVHDSPESLKNDIGENVPPLVGLNDVPDKAPQGSTVPEPNQSSEDEDEQPEEPTAQRRGPGYLRGLPDKGFESSALATSPPKQNDDALAKQPSRPLPGKVKPPSWLVTHKDASASDSAFAKREDSEVDKKTADGPRAQPSRSDTKTTAELEAVARDAEQRLEELLRGPDNSVGPAGPKEEPLIPSTSDSTPPPLPARARAPAWDDEEDDMASIQKPTLTATKLSERVNEGTLIDFEHEAKNPVSPLGTFPESPKAKGDQGASVVSSSDADTHTRLPGKRVYLDASTLPYAASPVDEADKRDERESQRASLESRTSSSMNKPHLSPTNGTVRANNLMTGMQQLQVKSDDDTSGQQNSLPGSRDRDQPVKGRLDTDLIQKQGDKIDVDRIGAFRKDSDARETGANLNKLEASKPLKIIAPKPIALRSSKSVTAPQPKTTVKPWEREAAMAAEISKGGIVRSSASHGGGGEDDPPVRQEGFSGVSSLISKWQQNVESNAPGWGRIGESARDRRSQLAGVGPGLGPQVANEAAAKRASSRDV